MWETQHVIAIALSAASNSLHVLDQIRHATQFAQEVFFGNINLWFRTPTALTSSATGGPGASVLSDPERGLAAHEVLVAAIQIVSTPAFRLQALKKFHAQLGAFEMPPMPQELEDRFWDVTGDISAYLSDHVVDRYLANNEDRYLALLEGRDHADDWMLPVSDD